MLQNLALERPAPSSGSKLCLPMNRVVDTVEGNEAMQKGTKSYSNIRYVVL